MEKNLPTTNPRKPKKIIQEKVQRSTGHHEENEIKKALSQTMKGKKTTWTKDKY